MPPPAAKPLWLLAAWIFLTYLHRRYTAAFNGCRTLIGAYRIGVARNRGMGAAIFLLLALLCGGSVLFPMPG